MIAGSNKAIISPESGGDQASMADQGADKFVPIISSLLYSLVMFTYSSTRHRNFLCSWASLPSFASRGSRKEEK
jgi:hypothetical protein